MTNREYARSLLMAGFLAEEDVLLETKAYIEEMLTLAAPLAEKDRETAEELPLPMTAADLREDRETPWEGGTLLHAAQNREGEYFLAELAVKSDD